MARPRMTQAQLDALPPKVRAATLQKRNERARAAGLPLPHPPARQLEVVRVAPAQVTQIHAPRQTEPVPEAPPPGIPENDTRALEIYERLKQQLIAENRWAGEATHGTLMTYCRATVAIEYAPDPAEVKAHIYTAQSRAATTLRLHDMTPVKVRKADKFGAGW